MRDEGDSMKAPSIVGKDHEVLTFMKQRGYPVFHKSNMFLRDFQYGVRDYFRHQFNKDVGTREADLRATEFVEDLVARGILQRCSPTLFLLNLPEFLNPPKVEEKAEAASV